VKLDLERSARTGTRFGLIGILALALFAPVAAAADEAEAAKSQPAASPAKPADGDLGMNYAPTAGVWRDRLTAARRRVLDATARLDDLNSEYARVLYERPDDQARIRSLAGERQSAQKKLSAARAAIPSLVEQARADGVSEQVLDLYEKATLD
jgi:hypothetical protein